MDRRDFAAWCKAATEKIRYGPDRDVVSKELRDHLEDRYDALIAQGVPEEEAARRTLEAMGSAEIIAPQLAAIHRPWLGWLVSTLKAVAIISVVFLALSIPRTLFLYTIETTGSLSVQQNTENITMTYDAEVSCEREAYHFTINRVAASDSIDRLYLQLTVRRFPGMPKFDAVEHFYAIDSNGNIYASIDNRTQVFDRTAGRWVQRGGSSHGVGHDRFALSLTEFDLTAQWVEIRYDRDGREIVLHIDLTGGEPVG